MLDLKIPPEGLIHSSSVTLHLASTVGITHQTAEAVVPEEGRIIV